MNMTKTEKNGEISKLWKLEGTMGISIWHNCLELPNTEMAYQAGEIALQQRFNFVFVRTLNESGELCLVFVSEQTDFLAMTQCLPFLSDHFCCYLCHHQLIDERLTFLRQNLPISTDTTAGKQLFSLLEKAAELGASDIHLESLPLKKLVRMRVNGRLNKIDLPQSVDEHLFSKIKLISRMDISKKRSPQDGHFPFTSSKGKRFDLRTSTIPGIYGEKIVIRLLPVSTVKYSMEELGFAPEHVTVIRKHIFKKSGLILFTGPTGSGKTTSLYAILNELLSEPINIITIEDPVEYRLDSITQVEVNELAGISFSSALRAVLRQDPDVILIGEIRDSETAQIAARAAQTGHLVLATLHCNTAFESLKRLQSLGVETDDCISALKLVISQRLVQRRCSCQFDPECKICLGTGASGRIPLMELLEFTPDLCHLIAEGKTLKELRNYAASQNHHPLDQIGEQLIKSGMITRKEFEAVYG